MQSQNPNAGNAGDIIKHALLAAAAARLAARRRPVLHVETHAGAGAYRFALDDRRRHLARPLPAVDESETAPFTDALRELFTVEGGEATYPGSPLIGLRASADAPASGAVLFETEPDSVDELRRQLASRAPRVSAAVVHGTAMSEMFPSGFAPAVPDAFRVHRPSCLPLVLVDPFTYVGDATSTLFNAGGLNRAALASAIVGAHAVRAPAAPDGVLLAWAHRTHAELGRDVRRFLRDSPVFTAHIAEDGVARPYHVVLAGLGPVGHSIAVGLARADWGASPLLSGWGFAITVEESVTW